MEQLLELLSSVRSALELTIDSSMPEPQASLLSGMLLGRGEGFPFEFYQRLQRTGTLHVVVVSGYNVSVLITYLGLAFSIFGPVLRLFLTAVSIILFVALVGFEPPVIRAALMGIISLLGLYWGRQKDALWVLFLAGAVMVLFDRGLLTNLSFQLSFLATLGLITVYPLLDKNFPKRFDLVRKDLFTTLSAQIMVWPLLIFKFGTFALLAPLVNTLVLWTVPLITIMGGVLTIFAHFVSSLGYLMMIPVTILTTYFVVVVNFFARFDWAFIKLGSRPSLAFILIFYFLIFNLLWFLSRRSRPEQN